MRAATNRSNPAARLGCVLPRVDQAPCPATVGAHDARTRLAALPDPVQRGEEVTITRRGRPVAKLVPLTAWRPPAPRWPSSRPCAANRWARACAPRERSASSGRSAHADLKAQELLLALRGGADQRQHALGHSSGRPKAKRSRCPVLVATSEWSRGRPR
jgi:prevent-host-death family protein